MFTGLYVIASTLTISGISFASLVDKNEFPMPYKFWNSIGAIGLFGVMCITIAYGIKLIIGV